MPKKKKNHATEKKWKLTEKKCKTNIIKVNSLELAANNTMKSKNPSHDQFAVHAVIDGPIVMFPTRYYMPIHTHTYIYIYSHRHNGYK